MSPPTTLGTMILAKRLLLLPPPPPPVGAGVAATWMAGHSAVREAIAQRSNQASLNITRLLGITRRRNLAVAVPHIGCSLCGNETGFDWADTAAVHH